MSESHRFETDKQYLPELRRLIVEGQVRLDFDVKHLRGLDSPVAVEAEVGRWAYVMIIVPGVVFWWLGWEAAAAALGAVILGYLTLGRRRIAANLRRRIMDQALKDIGLWRKLWRHGGVGLRSQATEASSALICQAPGDSWVRFAEAMLQSNDRFPRHTPP